MNCIYIYKGHQFNSEIELDDFLLENKLYESELGDIVFSQDAPKSNTQTILSLVSKDSKQAREKYKEWKEKNKIEYSEDGEEGIEDPPYIGVNKFLSLYINEEGLQLFPEFRKDEYWTRRFIAWNYGEYTDDEIELFELDKNNLPKITDNSIKISMRELIEQKWESQGKIGTALHNVLEVCFLFIRTGPNKGKYVFTLPDTQLKQYVLDHVESKNLPLLTDAAIDELLEYQKNLRKELYDKFEDEDLSFYPEFTITQDATLKGKQVKLLGVIDLLVVDKNGLAHVIDYKTSIHSSGKFIEAKKGANRYLLATYSRMLERYGLNMYSGKLMIAPILINGFRKDNDLFVYNDVNIDLNIVEIDTASYLKVWNNIDEFMPEPFKLSVSAKNVGKTVSEIMSEWLPNYRSDYEPTRESIIKFLDKNGLLKKNDKGMFVFLRKWTNDPDIIESDEAKFIDKVLQARLSEPARRLRLTQSVKSSLKDAIKNGIEESNFPTSKINSSKISETWTKDLLTKYCDGNWEIVDSELAESYGIIILKTIDSPNLAKQIDFIRVSSNILDELYNDLLDKNNEFKNRIGLTGNFEEDIVEKSKSNSLMLPAVNGNVELMETMLIINLLSGIKGIPIGSISVINPDLANGISASNEELLYCFTLLDRLAPIKNHNVENNFKNGNIQFASKFEIVLQKYNHIMNAAERNKYKDEYARVKSLKQSTSILDLCIDDSAEEKIKALKELLSLLENDLTRLKELFKGVYTTKGNSQQQYIDLYNDILIAISNLKGVDFRQQLRDHDKWLESIFIHTQGASGSYTDNAGNLSSETLNLVTKLVGEAYQNVRDDIQRERSHIYKLVKALKRSKGMSVVSENLGANLVNLYKNMWRETEDGDFMFNKPEDMNSPEEREFLEYMLDKINKNRYPNKSEQELEQMKISGSYDYYKVPLAFGGYDSVASVSGMMSVLKDKLKYLDPRKAFEKSRKIAEGVFNALQDYKLQYSSLLLYKMTNLFDKGESNINRLNIIKQEGIEHFEHNFETLLYKHLFAYSVLKNIDGVCPMIKAAMIHISEQGINQNTEFKDDSLFLREYFKNKILNLSIVDPKRKDAVAVLNMLKRAASTLTLAVAPVQAIYQSLQALWVDIGLFIELPDGKKSFTFNNFKLSLKIVYSDLSHFSDKPTFCLLTNETYGINDMDMNTYVDRISTAKKGFWNFDNLLFKFASRPDYYSRMTIFVSLMLGDGCYKAHSVVNGKLVYDWTKDDRFSKFALNPHLKTSDPEYNKLKSLYHTVATQFVIEHAKNADGTDFVLDMNNPMPLPRAYTNKEAESMKALSDEIYGYYSHEKKSLIMSTCIGTMWLQFKTYWSSKKNLYLQSGGVRLKGKWIHYEENGEKYYYQVDKDGNILYDEKPLSENDPELTSKIAPVMQWQGLWQEGIILTISDMARIITESKSFKKGWNDKWNNEDPMLRQAYRSNIKKLFYDISMFVLGGLILGALLGDWLKDLEKENKGNTNLFKGIQLAAANVAVQSVKNSFMDFNFIESVGSPVGQWTPFAFEWGSRTFKNWWNVATGDEDFWDGVVKTSGGLKLIKPFLDTIKPDIFKTESEGGTFGKK